VRWFDLKKILIFLFMILIVVSGPASYAEALDINGEGAVLMDYDTGEILFSEKQSSKALSR
jgi:D-alanyl-D-alanine carboxypeptidase